MISLSELANKLSCERKLALFCHVRPDGDAIGSMLALKLCLQSLGKEVEVFCDDSIPARFSFLPEIFSIKSQGFIPNDYTALVSVDSADITRLGCFAEEFDKHKNTYSIDHHISNPRYAKINYVVDSASNCENVLDLVLETGVEISKDMANLLALGLVTDTGNFRHQNVTPETFMSASLLKQRGADFNQIIYHNFNKQTKERAKLFGLVMSKIRYFYDDKFAVVTITKEHLEQSGAQPSETEGFIDFIMGIDTVEIGASIMEIDKNKYKISLRGKTANVNSVASAFGGGGHVLASGCQIYGEYEEVVDKLRYEVGKEIPE